MPIPAASGDLAAFFPMLFDSIEGGRRETLQNVALGPDIGIPGDAWCRETERNQDMQIAVMELEVAELIANGQPLTLFGDCLLLDLDLSARNLTTGSRLRIGSALLEVTPMPHNGCRKFRGRFGDELRHALAAQQ